VKEVMQGKGQRMVWVEGTVSRDDLLRVKTTLLDTQLIKPDHVIQPDSKELIY